MEDTRQKTLCTLQRTSDWTNGDIELVQKYHVLSSNGGEDSVANQVDFHVEDIAQELLLACSHTSSISKTLVQPPLDVGFGRVQVITRPDTMHQTPETKMSHGFPR